MTTGVSAFVPIPDHPRAAEEFRRLAQPLLQLGLQVPFLVAEGELERCWLYQHLLKNYNMDTAHFSYSIADNPAKNSLAYHIVQAQKTEWLVSAATVDRFSRVFVWIDYGIFHLPGITTGIIRDFLQRADSEQAIAVPGCWERPYAYEDNYPCWRFCGGVMVVPRPYIIQLDMAMKQEYVRWLNLTKNISWEVNTLARVELLDKSLPIWWYQADHDQTMFTNYQATENADGKQTQAVRGIEAGYR